MTRPAQDDFRADPPPPHAEVILPKPKQPSEDSNLPKLEFGDLDSSPGLAEYSELAPKGAAYLIRLATELELQGQWERSLLAWERVIDSCSPSESERLTAEDSIVRIRPTLTHWNIDPEGDVPIQLQLGTARKTTESLKNAAQAVAEIIRKDSDFTLLVTPRITTSRVRNAPANAPIAIYFSGSGDAENSQTDPLSISPEGDDLAVYQDQLLGMAYQLVRRALLDAGGVIPPRLATHQTQPETDFSRQITRLHWKIFAESLTRPPAAAEN
jgi:hypothetical protein